MVSIINERDNYRGNKYSVKYDPSECVKLNLNVVTILGFERYKSCWRVQELIDAMEYGADLPPVFLVPTENDLEFRLTLILDYNSWPSPTQGPRSFNYGGHHRALAAYIEGKPLKALILNDKNMVEKIDKIVKDLSYGFIELKPISETYL